MRNETKKKTTTINKLPPKKQDKLSSITSGTSKLVRRLGGYTSKKQVTNDDKDVIKTPLKVSTSLELGSEVQLEYNGVAVAGVIRYIGTTDFSPGKWCGIELTENIGKHNGTVNGKCYFVCRDSYGVFIRFNKVADKLSPRLTSTAPPGHTPGHKLKDPADMRITVKSVKTKPTSLPVTSDICDTEDGPKTVKKSSVKSYIKAKKDKKLTTKEILEEIRKGKGNGVTKVVTKNVVVSSFTAPAPVAPVVVSPPQSDSPNGLVATPMSSENNDIDEVFLLNNLSPAEDDDEMSSHLDDTITAVEVCPVMSEPPSTPTSTNDPEYLLSAFENLRTDVENDNPVDTIASKIPRRIGSVRKTSNSNKEWAATADRVKVTSSSDFTANLRKFSKERNSSDSDGKSCIPTRTLTDSELKTPAAFPKTGRTSKRALEFNKFNSDHNEQQGHYKSELEKRKSSLTRSSVPENSIARPRSTPSQPRKSVATSSAILPRKNATPSIQRKNETSLPSKIQTTKFVSSEQSRDEEEDGVNGGKHADSSTVMGNASVINASCYKKNSLDSGGDGNINLSGIVEATVIQNEATKKSKEGKTKKTLTKPNTSSKSKDNLQKEVDNLQNQLKERTDRITELELTIKNNNNNNLEEKVRIEKKRSELENQLNSKNLNILEVEEKYTAAQLLVNKSAKGFEALGIVIQYYIEQIETVTKQLSDAFEEKNQLDLHNQELSRDNEIAKSELQEIMTRLDAEKSRCETVQHDLETLAASHEVEINALTDRQQQEQDKLKSSLKIEKDNGIVKVKEEHQTEIERLNTEHKKEILTLTNQHQSQIQEIIQEKSNAINDLLTKHDVQIKANEDDHAQAVEELLKLHEIKVEELNERVTVAVNDRDRVQTRIEEIHKELESDSKVQQALIPYKHLPEELESLQVVLDLRNEEIKNNRLKNMELQKKVDEYYELKTKFETLSQENASLKESLKKRTLSERKLSVERDALLEKFENEIKKVNLLSMEKEQLLWRASNPDLSTSLPNVFEDVEDEGCSMSPLRSSGSFSTSPPISFAPAKLKRRMQPKLLRRVNTMSFYKTFNKLERK